MQTVQQAIAQRKEERKREKLYFASILIFSIVAVIAFVESLSANLWLIGHGY